MRCIVKGKYKERYHLKESALPNKQASRQRISLFTSYIFLILIMPLLSTLKYHLRSITSVILLGACAIYGVVISCVFNVIGQKRLSQWSTARCFNLIMGGILGISFKVINEHYLNESAPCIFISNHQSTLDILMLGRTFPKGCTVTSKVCSIFGLVYVS